MTEPRGWPIPPEYRDRSGCVLHIEHGLKPKDFSPLDVFDVIELVTRRRRRYQKTAAEILKEKRNGV